MFKIATAVLAFHLSPVLFAQDITPQREDLEQRRKTQERVEKAAEEAKKTALSGPVTVISYEDVMKDPDNVELNYAYARGQVARGDLLKAAATLERVLMVNPELPRVRLFYASVLFRLDNLDDAERELKTLAKQKLTESMRAELDGYVTQIKQRRRKTTFVLTLVSGFDFDENRNSAPSKGTRLAADIPTILDTNSTRKNDTAETMNASINLNHDLGYQAGHSLFASLSYYRAEQNTQRNLNLQSYNWSAGGTFKSPLVDVTATMAFGHLILAESTYQRTHGPTLRLDRKVSDRLRVNGTAGHQRADYARTEAVTTAHQRTGDQHFGGFGLNYALSQGLSLAGSFTYTYQGALEPFNTYQRKAWNLSLTKVLKQGRFTVLSVTPQLDTYDGPDGAISRKTRKDFTYRASLVYGTPLGFIYKPLDNLLLTLTYEYFHSYSNLPNNAYTNNKLSSSLTYRLAL